MKAILSADSNWGIGNEGKLLLHVPEDMKYFRRMTTGKIVVMGRETLESFPGKQPLKNRINIVLSRNGYFDYGVDQMATEKRREGIETTDIFDDRRLIVCRSLKELHERLKEYCDEDVFVIGGESVYKQLLPNCTEVYVTKFKHAFTADRHFPNLDELQDWRLESESESCNYNGIDYSFCKYVRNL